MIKINKKLKNQKMAETKSQKRTKKEITAKSDLTQSYSRSKKCVARKHVIAKLTNLKKGHQIFLPIVRHDKTLYSESPHYFVLLIPRGDGKSPTVNPCDHLSHFQRVLAIGKQRYQAV